MKNLYDKIPGAPNFRYYEFLRSDTAKRLGIDNTPADWQWENLERLAANVLQPVREKFGPIRITSGYRSVELNRAIGGSSLSNHCRGEASDIEPVNIRIKLIDIIEYIVEELEFRTVIAEYMPDGWVHVDYREGGNLKRLKLKDASHHYENITLRDLKEIY